MQSHALVKQKLSQQIGASPRIGWFDKEICMGVAYLFQAATFFV